MSGSNDKSRQPKSIRVHVCVEGRVQGVGFRAFTSREAMNCRLHGWVKNLPDGRVEAEAEGSEGAVNAWCAALRQGPRFASVREVVVEPRAPQDDHGGFHIIG